ncbi:MATE family efflux transporter [Psychrosphaera aestuarii]|uniref:MATE family efflux transporter n=1 Tax=Psychrosphaera aestuarii TaxID=1266052 RepID=UPI001FD35C54|nr:MATE family efflux transporter [Psychrosphaera aestuarii]
MILKKTQFKQTLRLAWPISLQSMLVTFLSMIDVMMVSHLGDEAIAAVGLGNRVLFVVMVIVMGLSWAVGILSAQYHGAGQGQKIRGSILIAICYSLVALIPVIVASYFLSDDIMSLGSLDPAVIALGETYLWITMPSMVFVAIVQVFENALRSINQVKIPLVFSSISIVLNVVLNYWLINGGLGIPPLGVAGAAWATTISRLFQLIILISFLQTQKHILYISTSDFEFLKYRPNWSRLLKLVLPMMLSFGIWSLGSFTYQLIFGRIGTTELAVISMLLPVEGIFLSIFFGIASACSIVVGQHLGANRLEEAWTMAKMFSGLGPAVALCLGVLLIIFNDAVLSPYQGVSEQTINLAKSIFYVIGGLAWLKVINMTLAMGILRAGGDNRFCLITDTLCMWLISIPLVWLAAFYWQLAFIWVVVIMYSEEVCKMFMFAWRVKNKRWMKNLTS